MPDKPEEVYFDKYTNKYNNIPEIWELLSNKYKINLSRLCG